MKACCPFILTPRLHFPLSLKTLSLPPPWAQVHPNSFLPKEWIMEKWEEGFYITSVAGSDSNNSLVVMSKGARFSQQSYKVRRGLRMTHVRSGHVCMACVADLCSPQLL